MMRDLSVTLVLATCFLTAVGTSPAETEPSLIQGHTRNVMVRVVVSG